MKMEHSLGKVLIIAGLVITAVGVVVLFGNKIPFIGKLPGDIHIERENFRFYFPLGTSILLSVLITAIVWIISLIGKK
jgi:hypothetical protein